MKLFAVIAIAIIVSLLLVVQLMKINTEDESNSTNDSDQYVLTKLTQVDKLEGNKLWAVSPFDSISLMRLISKDSKSDYVIFVLIDSFECSTCFKIHAERLSRFAISGIPTFVFAYRHQTFYQEAIERSILYQPEKIDHKPSLVDDYNCLVMLLDKKGRIIMSDIVSAPMMKNSNIFYSKLNQYLN